MIKTAVIMTVFNRREVTLQGLRLLYKSIAVLGEDYHFDIYMTDDGSTDGTRDEVIKEFPKINIIKGDGKLYWSGGMRKAWQVAIDSNIKYDFYLWFNDDAELFENAFSTLYDNKNIDYTKSIIVGAFCDSRHKASYGGKTDKNVPIEPNGHFQEIKTMNGNLVLIPKEIYSVVGSIDRKYKHGYGDYDYGYRAIKSGFKIFLTPCYVGVSDRHDVIEPRYFLSDMPLKERWKSLHKASSSPEIALYYNFKYRGLFFSLKSYVTTYFFTLFPWVYRHRFFLKRKQL